MNIIGKLLELDDTLEVHDEGHWSEPYRGIAGQFSSFNDAGVECETGEFLYSMVRMLKPDRVLETGTHWGIGSSYLAFGLKENQKGKLTTIEFLPEIHQKAVERFKRLDLTNWIESLFMDVREYEPSEMFDLILLDTEPQTRFAELIKFFDHLKPGGFVFIHDLHRHLGQVPNQEHGFAWPWGVVPLQMRALVQSGLLRPMHFPTPRGLTGFYKSHPDDFKWSNEAY